MELDRAGGQEQLRPDLVAERAEDGDGLAVTWWWMVRNGAIIRCSSQLMRLPWTHDVLAGEGDAAWV